MILLIIGVVFLLQKGHFAPGVADQRQPSTRAGRAVQRPRPESGGSTRTPGTCKMDGDEPRKVGLSMRIDDALLFI